MVDKDGGPAFPQLSIESGQRDGHGDSIDPVACSQGGMTLRDWYAGEALKLDSVGLVEAYNLMGESPPEGGLGESDLIRIKFWAEARAKMAFIQADAMLKARDR